MSGPNLGFDGRNLLAAPRYSCHLPFAGDLLEGAAVTVEPGLFPTQGLPALHDHIDVLGI
jgi:hypothetical protein